MPAENMLEGSSNSLTEISTEIFSFRISRLEETNSELDSKLAVTTLDFCEQEIGTSKFKLKGHFSKFLDLSEENRT